MATSWFSVHTSAPPHQHVPIKEILLLMTLYNLFRQDESFSLMQVTCTFVSSISWQPPLTLGTHIAMGFDPFQGRGIRKIDLTTGGTEHCVSGWARVCLLFWIEFEWVTHHCHPFSPPHLTPAPTRSIPNWGVEGFSFSKIYWLYNIDQQGCF